MKMKKLLLVFIISIMFMPFVVNSETCDNNKISIESIDIKNASDNVVEKNEPVINGMGVMLDLEMSEVDDSIEYEMTIRNDSNTDYKLDKNPLNIESDYIDYTFETKDKTNVVKAKSSSEAVLTIQYKNEVPEELLENGSFIDNKTIIIGLNDGKNDIISVLINPKTGQSLLSLIIMLLIIGSVSLIILKNNKKIGTLVLLLGLASLPFSVFALCSLNLKVESNVEIKESSNITYDAAERIKSSCTETCLTGTPNSDGLFKDDNNEYRYTGSSPNNYVNFNNETWRIVGLFMVDGEERIKLVRSSSLGSFSWDTSLISDSYGNNGYGINQWGVSGTYPGADLMRELNGDYLNTSLTSNVYWYNGRNNNQTGIFDKNNVLKESAQKLIDDATWYTGGVPWWYDKVTLNIVYSNERGTLGKACSSGTSCTDNIERTHMWTGKVGLIYLSDYIYASGNPNCKTDVSTFKNGYCNSNWMSNYGLTITRAASTGGAISVWGAYSVTGSYDSAYVANSVRPSVYLVPNIRVVGEGTSTIPFEFVK